MILVTGGTGYIGSHTVVELQERGDEVVIIDNLSNSKIDVLDRIEQITGKKPLFYKADVRDEKILEEIFEKHDIKEVIHFAGLKAVGESTQKPIEYYENNLGSTIALLKVMKKNNVKNIIFSSSATVYGDPESVPVTEDFPTGGTTNPYGTTKLMIEEILKDLYKADKDFGIVILRYFNPVGAHKSGLIGEEPNGIPNNLMPYVLKVATKQLPKLSVFGNDYPTVDGTGARDYIHVVDLAKGHIAAIDKLRDAKNLYIYNLGTGKSTTVIEMVKSFEKNTGLEVPYQVTERRPGDIAEIFASPEKAEKELGWKAELNIDDMCKSLYNFYNETNK